MEIIKKNLGFVAYLAIWTLSGMYTGPVVYGVIALSFILFKSKNMFMELFLGFFYVLIISDSRQHSLEWAANAKNICIVLLFLFMVLDRKNFSQFNHFYQKFVPFFIIAFICLFFAPPENIFTAFEKTLSYLFLILIVSNYVLLCHKKYGVEFFKTLVYLVCGVLLYGFLMKFLNQEQTYMEGRFRGILGNPNGLGIFVLLFFLMFSVIKDMFPDLFSKRERNIVYILIFASLLMSGSRNSLFAVFLFLIFSYFYKISPFLGFILFLIMTGLYQYISDNLVPIIEALGLGDYFRVNTLEDASGRYIAWNFAWDHIKQSIWLGKGFEYTNYLYWLYGDYLSSLGHNGNAHNSYLTLWLDTGLIGLFTYMWAFISSFFQAAKKSKLAIPLMYCIIFSTIFESWLTASLNPFTIQFFTILTILTSGEISERNTKAALLVQ